MHSLLSGNFIPPLEGGIDGRRLEFLGYADKRVSEFSLRPESDDVIRI